jgi:hypothetical protein
MGTSLIKEQHVALAADAQHVGSAWVLAAVIVTLLMTVVAPLLNA